MWQPGLRVAHAFRDGRIVCREVTGSYAYPWTPSDRSHCRMCIRRLPKPLTWTEVGPNRLWPDCGRCVDYLTQPFMAEAIASVGIERPINTRRLVEQYHEGGHRE